MLVHAVGCEPVVWYACSALPVTFPCIHTIIGEYPLGCSVFHLFESPKYLLSRGRQSEAVPALQASYSATEQKRGFQRLSLKAMGNERLVCWEGTRVRDARENKAVAS